MAAKAYNFAATFLCGKGDTNEGLNKTVYGNFTVTDSQAAPEVKLYNDGKLDETVKLDEIMEAKFATGGCVIGAIKTNKGEAVDTVEELWTAVSGGESIMLYTVDVTTTYTDANANGQHNVFKSTVTINHTVSKDGNW